MVHYPGVIISYPINPQVNSRHVIQQHLVDRHRGLYASVTGLLLQLEPRLDKTQLFTQYGLRQPSFLAAAISSPAVRSG